MKQLPCIIGIGMGLCLVGCDMAKVNHLQFPPKMLRVVHNKCLNVWAIQTGFHMPFCNADTGYWGDFMVDTTGWDSSCYPSMANKDSVDFAQQGHEYQFGDSASAIDAYTKFKRRLYVQDSIAKRPQFIKDSIFKCNHTYE